MAKKNKKEQKKKLVKISAFLLASFAAEPAIGQTLSCPQSLLFGNYSTCSTTKTATISPNNNRTTSGCLAVGGAPFSRARCLVTQTFPLRPIQFSIANTTAKVNHSTAADSMTVSKFRCINPGGKCTTANPITSTTFFLSVPIGATLTVGNPQTGGTYTGTFTVNAVLQ